MPEEEKYIYYKNKILSGIPYEDVIKEVKEEYNLSPDFSFKIKYKFLDIPFNLEREYVTSLIESGLFEKARKTLENMKMTYKDVNYQNFIENYEYHLGAVKNAEDRVKKSLIEAKKEFNNHTITLTGILVGVITILGAANQSFKSSNYSEGMNTFFSISLAIIFLIIVAFLANSFFSREK